VVDGEVDDRLAVDDLDPLHPPDREAAEAHVVAGDEAGHVAEAGGEVNASGWASTGDLPGDPPGESHGGGDEEREPAERGAQGHWSPASGPSSPSSSPLSTGWGVSGVPVGSSPPISGGVVVSPSPPSGRRHTP